MVNIPDVPGVPVNLDFSAESLIGIILAQADSAFLPASLGPTWGIFSGGGLIVSADTVTDFTFKKESVLSDYPVEGGAFESYDKVQVPYNPRIRFAAGGTESARAALLASIDAISGDLNLYDVITPEVVYTSVNVIHYDYHRTATSGYGLLQVDVWLEQVIVSNTAGLQSSTNPTSNDPISNGALQPIAPTSSQENTLVTNPPSFFGVPSISGGDTSGPSVGPFGGLE